MLQKIYLYSWIIWPHIWRNISWFGSSNVCSLSGCISMPFSLAMSLEYFPLNQTLRNLICISWDFKPSQRRLSRIFPISLRICVHPPSVARQRFSKNHCNSSISITSSSSESSSSGKVIVVALTFVIQWMRVSLSEEQNSPSFLNTGRFRIYYCSLRFLQKSQHEEATFFSLPYKTKALSRNILFKLF
jgi:hypothetical protein